MLQMPTCMQQVGLWASIADPAVGMCLNIHRKLSIEHVKSYGHGAADDAVTHSNNFIQATQEVPYGDIIINRGGFL